MKNLSKFKWLLLSIILSIASINQVWANWQVTVYFSPKADWISSGYTFKVNTRYDHKQEYWNRIDAVSTGKTQNGKPVYSCQVDLWNDWNHVSTMQIQAFDGNGTQQDQRELFKDTYDVGTGTYSGKWHDCDYDNNVWYTLSYDVIVNGGMIYFDNSTNILSNTYKYFVVGHNSYWKTFSLSQIDGTNIWYADLSGESWDDATTCGFASPTSSWGTNGSGQSAASKIATAGKYTGTMAINYSNQINSGKYYLYTPASSSNGATITRTVNNSYTAALHKTQTITVYKSVDGGSTYSSDNSSWTSGYVTADRYYMSSSTASTHATGGSVTTLSSSSKTTDVIVTSSVTFAGVANTGYTFTGWSNTTTPPDPESSADLTINPVTGTNSRYAFFKANQYNIKLYVNDGGSTYATQVATYNETATSRAGSLPTRSGYGFDGYWTASSGGTKVINKDGTWVSSVSGYTDGSGKWICLENKTLYAHWLAEGYYMIFPKDEWEVTTDKFSGSPLQTSIELEKSDYSSSSWKTTFKVRKVVANTASVCNDVIYGLNSSPEIGKDNTTTGTMVSGQAAITLQVYYDGTYTFELNTTGPTLTVSVPIVNQLQIFKDNNEEVTNNTNWTGPTDNVVTASVALETSHTYEFKPVYDSKYYGKGGGDSYTTLTRGSNSVTDLAETTNNLKITADYKGTYQFNFNVSTKALTVVYPTLRQVTFSASTVGSGTGNSSSPSAKNDTDGDLALSSGDYVANGDYVTFTSSAANAGYTFKGWYSEASPATWDAASLLETDASYTTSITANTTIYAVYNENDYTVTVQPSDADRGSVASGSVTGHKTTSTTLPTATAKTGYYFTNWTSDNGTITDADQASTASINNLTSTATATANFVPIWRILGSEASNTSTGTDGFGGWDADNDDAAITHIGVNDNSKDTGYVALTLEANKNYEFKMFKHDASGDDRYYGNGGDNVYYMTYSGDHSGWEFGTDKSHNCGITTAGSGTYKFAWNLTDNTLTAYYPASYTVTYGKVVSSGASKGSVSATGDDGDALESGKYVAKGSATFTATDVPNYTVSWRDDNSSFGASNLLSTDNPYTMSSIAADKTVYAHYAENLCTVTITANNKSGGSITVGGASFTWGNTTQVGVDTKHALVATPATGYYFAGWTLSRDSDFTIGSNIGEEYSSVTLAGLGGTPGSIGTLTANFLPLEKVYFRNWNEEANDGAGGALWENVYVYFSISYEEYNKEDCAKTNASDEYKAQMTLESGNVYWAYVPRATTKNNQYDIAFSNTSYGTGIKFYTGEGVMRADYRKTQSMFVPRHASTYSRNGTTYYNGYWKHHNLEPGALSGYSIERYAGGNPAYEPAAINGADRLHFIVENENTIRYSLRVDNVSSGYQNYMIYSDGNISYITYNGSPVQTGDTIKPTHYSAIPMSEYNTDYPRFYIAPTTQNIYTLTIDMSSDEMKLTVDYPVAKGDYRLHHTYVKDDNTYHAYSDIIKPTTSPQMVSMYINTANTPTLALECCTAISPVTWTDQSAGLSISTSSGYFDDGNGVYQFVFTDPASARTMSDIKIYDGEFYIKTDTAPGGWTAWKANVMEKNTITFKSDDPNTFDRSFCHWIDNTSTNVKCVIANDYNIAVSDTLASDAILGGSAQTLPYAAHVRFSYNSTTNELKRTYLSLTGDNKLQLEGNTVSSASMIRNTDGTTFTNNATTLTALSNFTYKVDVQAREKARVRLTSIYQTNNQSLVGTFTSTGSDLDGADNAKTIEVLGGSTSNTGYKTMRIIYDFKTNYIMAAWLVESNTNVEKDTALQADLMIIRQEQNDAYQLTLGDSKSMTAVKKVYGVMKFTKSFLNGSESRYARDLYWISFPFEVRLSDAFGMGTYGIHWIIERYDGYTRAQKGFWADSPSNWKFITPYQRDSGFVLKANEGYILALDLDELDNSSLVWDNGKTDAYLYFPSKGDIGTIAQATETINIDQTGYQCTINRATGTEGDRRIKDSYWHCIGVPSYANVSHDVATSDPSVPDGELWTPTGLLYFYDWNSTLNTLSVQKSSPQAFKAMHSYLVQYCDETITWTNVNKAPSPIAARLAETPDKEFQLTLTYDDEEQDHTYVRLTDETGVTNRFEFNQDLSKEYNGGKANIWTVTADTVEVAGNSMPKPLQTTLVPVGVKVVANGEYTLAMPEGTNGEDVYLIDNAYGTRTNLGLMPYTVTLTAGTYDSRFALEFGPIQDAPTGIDEMSTVNSQLSTEEVRKVFVGGRLYIIRDGKVYDAAGQRVE